MDPHDAPPARSHGPGRLDGPGGTDGADPPAHFAIEVSIGQAEGARYVLASPAEAADTASDRITWRAMSDEIHLLDVLAWDGGGLHNVVIRDNKITARLTFERESQGFVYYLKVWTRAHGVCLAYGGTPEGVPRCFPDFPESDGTGGRAAKGPHPPPKIEPPDGGGSGEGWPPRPGKGGE